MLRGEVISTWTELKAKLVKSLTEIKNILNKQVVVKSSPQKTFKKILTPTGINALREKLNAKQALIREIERKKGPKQLLDKEQQTRLDSLREEVEVMEEEIEEQVQFKESLWEEYLRDKDKLFRVTAQEDDYLQQLRMVNEKCDRLTDKLGKVKELVEKGEMERLVRLVKRGEI